MADKGNGTYIWDQDKNDWSFLGNVIGAQGPQGPAGVQGQTGSQGPAGPQGPQGEPGPTGATGPTGPQGEPGEQGPAGPIGEQGPEGPEGPSGPQGVQGIQGETGPIGPEGPAGPAGEQGPAGPQGIQGLQGEPGPQGPEGPAGKDGTSGADGSKFCQYFDSNMQVNDFYVNHRAQKAYILPKTAVEGDICFSYKFSCYCILGEDKGTYFEVDPNTVFFLPSGPQGQPGDMIAWNVMYFDYDDGKAWLTDIKSFTGGTTYSFAPGQFFYTTCAHATYFGTIAGIGTWQGIDNVPYAYVADMVSITGVQGTPGRGVYAVNADFSTRVIDKSAIIGPATPIVGDVVYSSDLTKLAYIVSVSDTTFTIGDYSLSSIGPMGPQGIQGLKGDKGDKGDRGPQGLQGPMGEQGPTGPQGIQGLKGDQGPRGLQGPQGEKGSTGERGPQGLQGLRGYPGPKGDKGDIGPQGPAGTKMTVVVGTFVTTSGTRTIPPNKSGYSHKAATGIGNGFGFVNSPVALVDATADLSSFTGLYIYWND